MGLLLLPSLKEKRHIRIENLSQNEAEKFIKDLEARVSAERTLKTPDTRITDSFKVYRLIEDLQYMDIDEIADELKDSTVPKHRGIRAVFIDEETDTIIVGTTVVYSANWAMIGFDDSTIEDTILSFE